MLDIVLTIINVILAVVSAFGAWNSIKYFRKSKNLTIFAQTNKALVEVQKMLIKLPEALSASLVRAGKGAGGAAALLHSFFSGRVRGVPDFLCHWKGMAAETAFHQGLSDLEFYGP